MFDDNRPVSALTARNGDAGRVVETKRGRVPHTTLSDPSQMAYVDAIHTDVALVVLFRCSCRRLATNQVSRQHLISIRVVTHMGISTLCSRRDWVAGFMGTS